MLYAKRQSYNRNTQQDAKGKMRKAYPYTSQKYPKNIHQYTKATSRIGTTPNLFSKWTQCQQRHFEGLQTKRDTDNRYHHQKTGYQILNSRKYASKQEPQEIHKQIHTFNILIL